MSEELVRVRFDRASPPNMPGDEASFPPAVAADLVERRRVAAYVGREAVEAGIEPEAVANENIPAAPATTAMKRAPVKK